MHRNNNPEEEKKQNLSAKKNQYAGYDQESTINFNDFEFKIGFDRLDQDTITFDTNHTGIYQHDMFFKDSNELNQTMRDEFKEQVELIGEKELNQIIEENEDNFEASVEMSLHESVHTYAQSIQTGVEIESYGNRAISTTGSSQDPSEISDCVDLREYQLEIFKLIEQQWFGDPNNKFGSIIFMATGSGKTFVAIMLILRIFGQELKLRKQNKKDIEQKHAKISNGQNDIHDQTRPKVAFMVPTTNLVEQQAEAINQYTDLLVGKFSGNHQKSNKSVPGEQLYVKWQNQLKTFDVFVFTEKKLYDVLKHGFLKIEDFEMIVFDECHHADQSHYYNLIMEDFFFYHYSPDAKRPKILGLTASPIKQKLGDSFSTNITSDIKEKLQNLANNLYSKFVCISMDHIKSMEQQQTNVIIEKYEFNLDEKRDQVQMIKNHLVKKLCDLIHIDEKTIKCSHPNGNFISNEDPSLKARQFTDSLNLSQQLDITIEKLMMKEFEKVQDIQVVKFLKKRYEFIGIDLNYVKSNIDIQSFTHKSDQNLLIFIIIILKNANNLILELGTFAFMQFLNDTKHFLMEGSPKYDQIQSILEEFSQQNIRNTNETERLMKVSNKVNRLIAILNNQVIGARVRVPKVIIFVKDRVVAEYLRKILQKHTQLSSQDVKNEKLLSFHYRVDMAMGPRGKNLVNKAYRSTKASQVSTQDSSMLSSEDDSFGSGLVQLPSKRTQEILKFRSNNMQQQNNQNQSNVKMSNNQLKEVLQKFRSGAINVLIATNVVEEGLDVSECNLVVCMNEMLNVKAFIQMKGRARQQDSKFIFLCAKEEFDDVNKEKKNFSVVINQMKELAFGRDSKFEGIKPDPDILVRKTPDELQYFEIEQTGARISMRDSKLLLDTFCKAALEHQKYYKIEQEIQVKVPKLVHETEPYYRTTQTAPDEENRIFFLSCVYLPKTCAMFVNNEFKLMPECGFLKKKDSENHVALLALKKLYDNGWLDDYLFPKCGAFIITKPKQNPPSEKKIKNNQIIDSALQYLTVNMNMQRSKKVMISQYEFEEFKKEQEDFEKEIKSNKSKFIEIVEESYRSLIKEKLFTNEPVPNEVPLPQDYKLPVIYIHCLKDINSEDPNQNNKFPFQTTKDHLGIVFDRKFDQTNSIRFWMFQEKKQKEKNKEYLNMQLRNELISQHQFQNHLQSNEMIELELNKKNLIVLDLNKTTKSIDEAKKKIQQLKFFHTWVFYYFYCADHKFLKHIFKNKFTFVRILFGRTLNQIYSKKEFCLHLKSIYTNNNAEGHFKSAYKESDKCFIPDYQLLELYPFITPLKEINGQLQLNWTLIENIQNHIEKKLMDIAFVITSRSTIIKALNLDTTFQRQLKHSPYGNFSLLGIWDDKFTGVRYVKLCEFRANVKWSLPTLHLERRNINQTNVSIVSSQPKAKVLIDNFEDVSYSQASIEEKKSVAPPFQSQFSMISEGKTERQRLITLREPQMDIYTVQQYNYEKYGIFLNPNSNPKLYEVRKERHFVDFSKTPKQLEKETSAQSNKLFLSSPIAPVSSKFDVTEQLIEKSPLSYEQYQVLQQSCTHLLYFNEFLQVEKFIRDKFKGLKCFLTKRSIDDMARHKETQKSEKLSIDQIISQSKENLQSDLKPSSLSRNIFISPLEDKQDQQLLKKYDAIHTSAENQLLNNIDIMMEALTAPNANRNYDYERLEFYGDSVISFLVILELFLTKDYTYKEGDLDFYRIQQVSNMRFFKINKEQLFFKYMINEPQTIFNDFVPGAFEKIKYQDRIKHKTLNEINNKVTELKKLQIYLQDLQDREKTDTQLVHQLRKYLKENNCSCENYECRVRSFADDQTYSRECHNMAAKSDKELIKMYSKKVQTCIQKINSQKQNKKEEIDAGKSKNFTKRTNNKKQFFFKQLADIVESVTGAATVACGLNLTQNYLKQINVLNYDQAQLAQKLADLKRKKSLNRQVQQWVQIKIEENGGRMKQIEKTIKYEFKNKLWLVEALTHKSYNDQQKPEQDIRNHIIENQCNNTVTSEYEIIEDEREMMTFDDYERLEFLGDAILNFLIAEHFYETTVNDTEKKMPKELHKMKTSVINNAMLSLIVIENGIHEHVLYNNKAQGFKEQFDKYVSVVQELLASNDGGGTKESGRALDLDQLYEYNLKIFGDVFESIIGAVFIDSEDIIETWRVLKGLMQPYIKVYANLTTLQDHSRTKLLELWNQKPYMRNYKCHHETHKQDNDQRIFFYGKVDDDTVLEMPFDKDAKNKVRSFYRQFYSLIQGFFEMQEKKNENTLLTSSKYQIVQKIIEYRDKHFKIENE